MVDNGFRQAEFAGGGQVLDLVAFFNSAQSDDAAAVLEHNRIRNRPAANQEKRHAEQDRANWGSQGHAPYLFILIRRGESARPALFPHAEYDYTSCMKAGAILFALWYPIVAAASAPAGTSPPPLAYPIHALRYPLSRSFHPTPPTPLRIPL